MKINYCKQQTNFVKKNFKIYTIVLLTSPTHNDPSLLRLDLIIGI